MFSLIQKRRWFFMLSAAVIIPGIIIMLYSLATTGTLFRLSNDFVGGSLYELKFTTSGATESNIRDVFEQHGSTDISIQQVGDAVVRWSVRANFEEPETQNRDCRRTRSARAAGSG
ncbi:MAG: hypothetical protein U0521_23500 [Anaerolineae bacterium]